jgi:dTDP-glucose 4,6-dehydratase
MRFFLGTYRINGKRLPSPNMVVNFAAESHVDRSILGPVEFIKSNIHGTFCLLEAAKGNWQLFPGYMASKPAAHGNNHTSYQSEKPICRFLHVSTDEVYGSLSDTQAFSVRLRNMIPAAPIQPPKQPQII